MQLKSLPLLTHMRQSEATVQTFNSRTKYVWAKHTTARPNTTLFLGHECMDDLIIERSFESNACTVALCSYI